MVKKSSIKTRVIKTVGLLLMLLFAALSVRAVMQMPKVSLTVLIPDETLTHPVHVEPFPGNEHRFAVVEKNGVIKWAFDNSNKADGVLLDISQVISLVHWEDGLLSLAFDPQFAENHFYYIWYTTEPATTLRLSRLTMNENLTTDPSSELVILQINKTPTGHNGGTIKFDNQGYLYLSIGEAMSGEGVGPVDKDVLKTTHTLFGSLIRIDVRGATKQAPYKIPSDNPFINEADEVRKEIWAHGFRNPWRFSIDPVDGEIWLADVGRDDFEEINLVKKGAYYGWPEMEGTQCYPPDEAQTCDKSGKEMPIAEFDHGQLRAIAGGYIYRGNAIPWLKGQYVFADYIRGLYSIDPGETGKGIIRTATILSHKSPVPVGPNKGEPIHVVSITPDINNEFYLADIRGGVYRLRDVSPSEQVGNFLYHLFRF